MRFAPILALVAVSIASTSTMSWAWNDRGHMMVAAVAWNNLTFKAKTRATELLRLNPHYKTVLIKGTDKFERDQVAFVRAATWPDFIKDLAKKPEDADADDYIDHGNDPDKSPDPNRNVGYEDKFLHKYWHFVDLPFAIEGASGVDPKKPNALTRIILHRDTIKDKSVNDDLKSYDLVWLLHLVGDVHQPLHATQRFSTARPHGDAGGNLVTVCEFKCDDNETNLHSFWDDSAGLNASVFSAIKAADKLDEADSAEANISDPNKWIMESFTIAKAFVYRQPPIGPGDGPFALTASYQAKAADIAEERIALAGARLAKLLNNFLK